MLGTRQQTLLTVKMEQHVGARYCPLPIFRSRITAAVLTKTYVGDSEYSIAELARLAHTDTGTMSREVKRLEAAGILRSRDVGRTI